MANSESERLEKVRMNEMVNMIYKLTEQIVDLEKRLIRAERAYDALGRRLEGSERHIEDEGWFD